MTPANSATRMPGSHSGAGSRFAWAFASAAITFAAMVLIDWLFGYIGLRREETLIGNFVLSGLVFMLVFAQQVRHERELERNEKVLSVIAEMNHHTRNALQVIIGRSSMSIADSNAIAEIREAVKRIEWSLREVLPSVSEQPAESEDKRNFVV